MLGIGVIGYGCWGPHLVRNFAEAESARVVAVSDLDPARLALVAMRFPSVRTTTDPRQLIDDPAVNAVAICTPVSTHFELARLTLRARKHVLVEKPLTASVEQAEVLLDEAAQRRLTLMVDHTFVYTDAVRTIRHLVESGDLGTLYYYDAIRVNLGLFQHEVNVLWDLAVHDLAIMDYVLPSRPYAVSAIGMSHVPGGHENIAYLTLLFRENLIAHVHVNWLAPVKVRRTLVGGSRQMIVYDDIEPSEKLKVYDKGITVANGPDGINHLRVSYRMGDMWAPRLDLTEALRSVTREFVGAVVNGVTPPTGGEAGLRVVELLEAATLSMKQFGQLVELKA